MAARITNILDPELFIGFVSPIGADVQSCVDEFRNTLCILGYNVVDIKVTDIFERISAFVNATEELKKKPEHARYTSHIAYGNQLRKDFEDDAFLSALSVGRIAKARRNIAGQREKAFQNTAYLVHQFKRKEEIDLLRSVYGRLFFQISVYSRRGARVDHLAHSFAGSDGSGNINSYRSHAEEIVQKDENENNLHGQKVSKIFHDGDFIVNTDIKKPDLATQVERFCYLLFGHNGISPSKIEYGMFVAKAAALRTLDLSRQIGAAIFSKEGEVISIGSNEVPKAGGGTYWSDEDYDDREYIRKFDSNDRRKKAILGEIATMLGRDKDSVVGDKDIADSQLMDALEYGRIIHAEMSAITDAARLGRSIKNSLLFSTAFPCHMCAKHIVSSGVEQVIFLEPYPKSLVLDLHNDAISVEGGDRGKYSSYPSVAFDHFYGVSPRRYREMFERTRRKDESGSFKKWERDKPHPNLDVTEPYYLQTENFVLEKIISVYFDEKKMDDTVYALDKIAVWPATSVGDEPRRVESVKIASEKDPKA